MPARLFGIAAILTLSAAGALAGTLPGGAETTDPISAGIHPDTDAAAIIMDCQRKGRDDSRRIRDENCDAKMDQLAPGASKQVLPSALKDLSDPSDPSVTDFQDHHAASDAPDAIEPVGSPEK